MPIDELVRFKDLQRLNVAKSWAQLRHMQKHYAFPAGILLGPNTRAWSASEVKEWLASRPTEVSQQAKVRAARSIEARRANKSLPPVPPSSDKLA